MNLKSAYQPALYFLQLNCYQGYCIHSQSLSCNQSSSCSHTCDSNTNWIKLERSTVWCEFFLDIITVKCRRTLALIQRPDGLWIKIMHNKRVPFFFSIVRFFWMFKISAACPKGIFEGYPWLMYIENNVDDVDFKQTFLIKQQTFLHLLYYRMLHCLCVCNKSPLVIWKCKCRSFFFSGSFECHFLQWR